MLVQLTHDVAFGHDPDDTLGTDHDHGADVLLGEAGEQLLDRCIGVDRHHRRTLVPQDVRDPHRASSRCDLLHTRLRLTRAAGKPTRGPTTNTVQYPQAHRRNLQPWHPPRNLTVGSLAMR